MKKPLLLAAAAAFLFAAPAFAHEVRAGALTLSSLQVRAPIGDAKTTAAYLTVANAGAEADRLVSVSCACAASASLHDMTVSDGIMRMSKAPFGFEVPANGALKLAPGGKHVMLTGLKGPLKDGERVDLVLEFAKAGRVKVDFHITADPAAAKPAAGGHMH